MDTRSGGAVAYKVRDLDGHPLELIEFSDNHGDGVDRSALSVGDAERRIGFYCETLGLQAGKRQVNNGPDQEAFDGLDDADAEVVALKMEQRLPSTELLAYRPAATAAPALRPCDIAASRLVLGVQLPGGRAVLAGARPRWPRPGV